jgi:hypothetical protein
VKVDLEADFKQMLVDKKALSPVHKSDHSITELNRSICSFMFLETIFDELGRFEKIKVRVVAN